MESALAATPKDDNSWNLMSITRFEFGVGLELSNVGSGRALPPRNGVISLTDLRTRSLLCWFDAEKSPRSKIWRKRTTGIVISS